MNTADFKDAQHLHTGGHANVHRATRVSDGRPVILKTMRDAYPTGPQQARFRREYDLICSIDAPGIVEALDWSDSGPSPVMVLEDFGGASLERLFVDGPPPVDQALELAIMIVKALQRVHDARTLHLDLTPANIVYNPDTRVLKLIDFGLSIDLPRQAASLQADRVLQGTPRFAAPEQAGRMNRSVDYRSDYYSLGATLYWLFTGRPPFVTEDLLELVHAHMARRPEPLTRIEPTVPESLSDVVMKLLEKSAEDRYQSTFGILSDLERCRSTGRGATTSFQIGLEDRPARFSIPERLYGRVDALQVLFSAFDRASEGGREVVLVSGPSGMGKSALVSEMQRPLARRDSLYVSGKFDQFNRDTPYASLGEAMRGFVRVLLTQQHGHVDTWRKRISDSVGVNGGLLTQLIPELTLILGEQPPVEPLPPLEAEGRLHLTMRRFMRLLATSEHPLVLFMDDLQWADLPSIQLLRVLATDPASSHLLFIGAYRDQEIKPGHPIHMFRQEIEDEAVAVSEVQVTPLSTEHITALLSDTLRLDAPQVAELASWCHDKTAGNPFFVQRFLYALVEEELLAFDTSNGVWTWDLPRILAQDVTENVGEFLATRLERLSRPCLDHLVAAACIGGSFSAQELAEARGLVFETLIDGLKEPLIEGLIEEVPPGDGRDGDRRFRFMHDHIQQAARDHASPEIRQQTHRRVGAMLLAESADPVRDPGLFEMVTHVNAGADACPTPDARQRLITLNVAAGRRALSASAHAPAKLWFDTALIHLGPLGWETDSERMREVVGLAAMVAGMGGDYERMDGLVDDALEHARDQLDRSRALRVRIDALIARLRHEAALEVGLEALESVGIVLPKNPTEADIGAGLGATFARLEGIDLADIATGAPPDDASSILAMDMLCVLAPPAYFFNQALLPLLGVELVRLTVERGPTSSSSYGFALLGLVLCDVGHLDQGYAFGQLASQLSARFPDKRMRVRAEHVYFGFARHWKEPADTYLPDYHRCFELAMDIGDFEYAGYAGMMHTILAFYLNDDLHRLERSARFYAEAMTETKQMNSLAIHGILFQAILNLRTSPEDPVTLTGDAFNEAQMLALFRDLDDATCLFVLHCIKAVLAGQHGQWQRCHDLVDEARAHTLGAAGTIHKVALEQWDALACLALADGADREALLLRAEACLERLRTWAEHNPSAHGHRPGLVQARKLQVQGDTAGALAGFDQAARLARRNKRVADEALALRLAGELCLQSDLRVAARAYLLDARLAFQRLGARSCQDALEKAHPQIKGQHGKTDGQRLDTTTQSVTASVDIDVEALIRASAAVAKERNPTRLIETIVRVSMEGSGAARCLVVTPGDDGLAVTASGTVSTPAEVHQPPFPLDADRAPEGLIQFVARTRETIVLDDARADDLVLSDPYVNAHEVRSMLCLPIEQQGRLMAVLYLEHPEVIGAFTRETVGVLRVLVAQAAIAAENAALIDTLEEKVRARTQELAAASEAKSVFLRSMSHELRTPLNGILGYAQLLLDRKDNDPKRTEALDTIRASGQHLLALINDILDMNKIEAGALDLVASTTQLTGFVEGVTAFFTPEAHRKGLVLTATCDPALPPWITTDARRLRQIVLNLIGNSVKFTRHGRVTVESRATPNGLMQIEVSDTGPGIPPDRLAAIFEPFKQAGPSQQRAKGTGLGLAIAREIAHQMGGTLTVQSVEGEGTTFTLEIPVVASAPAGDAVFAEPVETAPAEPTIIPHWPDIAALDRMLVLVHQGAIAELGRQGQALEADPALGPFGSHLVELARGFDDVAIEAFLEQGRSQQS